MKKHFILYMGFISILYGIEISKSENFEELIEAENKTSSFSISIENQDSSFIEKKFKYISKIVEQSKLCEGGKYNIYPFNKTQDRKIIKIYRSNISFKCNFKENKKYEELLSNIKKQNLKISQNQINYTASNTQIKTAKKTLENKIFLYAKEYSKDLNKHFKNCKTKTIDLLNNHIQYRTYKALSFNENSSTNVTSPLNNKVAINLNANFTFICD